MTRRRDDPTEQAQTKSAANAPLIDFLPVTVHEQVAAKRELPMRRLVVAVSLSLFALGYFAQHRRTAALQERRNFLASQQTAAIDPATETRLRETRERREQQANLLASFLPLESASRLVAAVAAALPEASHLTNLKLAEVSPSTAPPPKPNQPTGQTPWQQDLANRMQVRSGRRLAITVEGLVKDDQQLGEFLSRLQASDHFETIDVVMSEPATLRQLPRRRFRMQLTTFAGGDRESPPSQASNESTRS